MSNLPSLPSVLPIRPFTEPARGEVMLPGSKSITNRALLLAALCDGPVTLTGALFSEDTEIMAEALNRLGIEVQSDAGAKTFQVTGKGGEIPAQSADIFIGNAGTAARFLTALCASAKSGVYRLDGVPQMRKRPMKGLIDALRSLGADIRCTGAEGFFPLEIRARGLRGGRVEIDASESSQMLSALLMVAPLSDKPTTVQVVSKVRRPFVQMTLGLLDQFGQNAIEYDFRGKLFRVSRNPNYRFDGIYCVEPDATAASYFLALPIAAKGSLLIPGLSYAQLQGDALFIAVLQHVGAKIVGKASGFQSSHDGSSNVSGVTRDFSGFSDTFLTLAAIAPLLDGPSTIAGIAHTRKQETDRVAGMAKELQRLGHGVDEKTDSLTITPNLAEMKMRAQAGIIEIETYGDHRFAMSFAILGCYDLLGTGRPWLAIRNPACCAKTFPNFFDVLGQVWEDSHSRTNPTFPQPA